ncbi:hypothetical protein GCM10027046_27000 [Uliginosibacterium flavum]|uniref:Bifunctional diguanylate cyclase/phosphodiesterase n=1 Tax=Uliginosibacterium flavum TaxID=1396831 RepID=A0ABV2TM08_9RHOO
MIFDTATAVAPRPVAIDNLAVPGLPDRATFLRRLEMAIRTAERQNSSFAVLLLDAGLSPDDGLLDLSLLNKAAIAIRATVRLSDTVAFLSGCEFAVLLSVGNEEGAMRVAGKIISTLGEMMGLETPPDVAVGVAMFSAHGKTGEALLRAAEGALYQARRSNRDIMLAVRAEVLSDEFFAELEERIGTAIEQDEFVLHFQPVVKLQTGLPVSTEALARWHHPELGLMRPAEFLHLAESEGNVEALSLRLTDRALNQARIWRERGMSLSLSLNISTALLECADLDQKILSRLHTLALEPRSLTLELRDEGLSSLSPTATKSLFSLASAGVCLSIDDFGRGAGALRSLRDLPVQEFKIDAEFSAQVCRSEADAAIVASLVTLGRKLGKVVIAKGIESEEVRQKLCDLGCEYGQGFHFAQALDASELENWCENRLISSILEEPRAV